MGARLSGLNQQSCELTAAERFCALLVIKWLTEKVSGLESTEMAMVGNIIN